MERFIQLFGYSYHSIELNKLIHEFEINYPEKPFLNYKGDIMMAHASNPSNNIHLDFEGANYAYPAGFGNPKSTIGKKEEEIILMEVTIDSNIIDGVLGLRIGDSQEDVIKKITTKPKEKSVTDSGERHNWIFWLENYKLQVAFNQDLIVDFIRARQYEKSEQLRIKLKALIREQKQNIKPENTSDIKSAGDLTFLDSWDIEPKHVKKKNELVQILNEYILLISEHTLKKSASKIYSQTSKLVKAINKLNDSTNFIETNEREDLCQFIDQIVCATGFEIPEGLDITEEFRMW